MAQEKAIFKVELPVFSGPLDLLLHLVQKEQVSIWDVSLAKVTEEYLSYIGTMQKLNLEVTCEFLVLAASLLQIKARSLLPKPSAESQEDEEDVKDALIRRLIDYKRFKMAADAFANWALEEAEVFGKMYKDPALEENEPAEVSVETDASIWKLLDIVQGLLESREFEMQSRGRPQVPRKHISLTETILSLRERFTSGYRCSFRGLLQESTTKEEVIVTFLASLELIRLGVVRLISEDNEVLLVAAEEQ